MAEPADACRVIADLDDLLIDIVRLGFTVRFGRVGFLWAGEGLFKFGTVSLCQASKPSPSLRLRSSTR